ncbi:MAG: glycosyltransferase family 4 protein [Ferruginibacter sp.]
MVVIYYTCPYYLDTAIEVIKAIKRSVELHIVIEINPPCKNSTLINIESLEGLNEIETGENVLGKEKWEQFKPYFEGAASVTFAVQSNQRSYSLTSLMKAFRLGRYLQKFNADIIHFDTITTRAMGLYPFIRSMKLFVTVHDPLPHSGEASWKENLPNWVFLSWAKGFFFYSDFASKQFSGHFTYTKGLKKTVRFQPVTFISYFKSEVPSEPNMILFFGRLSIYKGIDILIKAIPKVLEKYPNEKFMIAGAPVPGFSIDESIVQKYKNNITIISRFLDMDELVKYIEKAKFVVCPYRDATQSGVLMTALAVGKMVVATDVGSFSEYIQDNINGMLSSPDPDALADKIIEALDNNKYKQIEARLHKGYSDEIGKANENTMLSMYKNALSKK